VLSFLLVGWRGKTSAPNAVSDHRGFAVDLGLISHSATKPGPAFFGFAATLGRTRLECTAADEAPGIAARRSEVAHPAPSTP
jgi:hypothetical protein